jgi:hypothetical protein
MMAFGIISVTGLANRDVYFKGIYDIAATRIGADGKSETSITAPLGEHRLVTITDTDTFTIDHEGVGTIRSDGEHIEVDLESV